MATIRVRFWLGATGPNVRVLLCLRGCRLPLRLIGLAGTEAWIFEWAACPVERSLLDSRRRAGMLLCKGLQIVRIAASW